MIKKDTPVYKYGDPIGNFTFVKSQLEGKNKTWHCKCICGNIRVFWKHSAIARQKSCGCGTDKCGTTKKQRRSYISRMQGYKSGASARGFEWNLSYDDFVQISSQDCFYCGSEPKIWDCMSNAPSLQKDSPNVNPKDYQIRFNGIDRVDSKLGYNLLNCVSCCQKCNRAKSDLSLSDFKDHVKKMYMHLYER
jgi:hypothetical protein